MGREIAEAVPEAMAVYDEGSKACGLDLRRLCFSAPVEELVETEVQQPALVDDEPRDQRGAARARHPPGLRRRPLGRRVLGARRGRHADRAATRSRSCASAGSRWPRPRRSCRARWRRSSASPTRSSRRSASKIHNVWPANYNCPGQLVISGENDARRRGVRRCRARGRPPRDQAHASRARSTRRSSRGRPSGCGRRSSGRLHGVARAVHVDGDGEARGRAALPRAAAAAADRAGALHAGRRASSCSRA